jgi:hypothetical protein
MFIRVVFDRASGILSWWDSRNHLISQATLSALQQQESRDKQGGHDGLGVLFGRRTRGAWREVLIFP